MGFFILIIKRKFTSYFLFLKLKTAPNPNNEVTNNEVVAKFVLTSFCLTSVVFLTFTNTKSYFNSSIF